MEDGDVIDALLQQACAHLISHYLRSSSRLFRSEVAHAFAYDPPIFDLESLVDSPSTVFFCCTYQSLSITQDNFVLNFVIESAISGKIVSEAVLPPDADVRWLRSVRW
jgi:hypothetical protein